MKKKIKITFIGNSIKFIKVFKSIYPKSKFSLYTWRSIGDIILKKNLHSKNDIVVICGYDYNSQWYAYKEYYNKNVLDPLKLAKLVSKKESVIFYIDTINKVKKNKILKKKHTLSRYEFAKKDLGRMLLSNFKFVKILTVPVLTNKKNKADIHGSFFTKMIFNFLIYFNLINSINNANLKKLIIKKIYSSKKDTINFLNPIFLNIPRSLFLDRILRFIYD